MSKDELIKLITEVMLDEMAGRNVTMKDTESKYRFAKFYGELVDAHGGDRKNPEKEPHLRQ